MIGLTFLSEHSGIAYGLPLALLIFFLSKLESVRTAMLGAFVFSVFPLVPIYIKVLSLWIPGDLPSSYSAFTDGTATFLLVGVVLYLQQNRSHQRTQELLAQLNASHTQLQNAHAQLAGFALRVEDLTMQNERQRLARELHDTLSQGLAGVVMQLDAATAYFSKGVVDRAQEVVQQTMHRVRTMLTETRYVIDDLRSNHALRSDDLLDLVQEEIDRFTASTGISCITAIDALAMTPTLHIEQVLRVISESLTNIASHAGASHAWVYAEQTGTMLAIEVRDDGIGFDHAAIADTPGHYGLIGLRERSRLVGGQLEINSAHGQGTCVRLCIPCIAIPEDSSTPIASNQQKRRGSHE